jgi:hypothetical protein
MGGIHTTNLSQRIIGQQTLPTRGLEEPFFQLCCCVSVFCHRQCCAAALPASAALLPPPACYHRRRCAAVNNAVAFVFGIIIIAVGFFILEKQLSSQIYFS